MKKKQNKQKQSNAKEQLDRETVRLVRKLLRRSGIPDNAFLCTGTVDVSRSVCDPAGSRNGILFLDTTIRLQFQAPLPATAHREARPSPDFAMHIF